MRENIQVTLNDDKSKEVEASGGNAEANKQHEAMRIRQIVQGYLAAARGGIEPTLSHDVSTSAERPKLNLQRLLQSGITFLKSEKRASRLGKDIAETAIGRGNEGRIGEFELINLADNDELFAITDLQEDDDAKGENRTLQAVLEKVLAASESRRSSSERQGRVFLLGLGDYAVNASGSVDPYKVLLYLMRRKTQGDPALQHVEIVLLAGNCESSALRPTSQFGKEGRKGDMRSRFGTFGAGDTLNTFCDLLPKTAVIRSSHDSYIAFHSFLPPIPLKDWDENGFKACQAAADTNTEARIAALEGNATPKQDKDRLRYAAGMFGIFDPRSKEGGMRGDKIVTYGTENFANVFRTSGTAYAFRGHDSKLVKETGVNVTPVESESGREGEVVTFHTNQTMTGEHAKMIHLRGDKPGYEVIDV